MASSKIGLNIEWTLDNDPFELNPILCPTDVNKIRELCGNYHVSIPSITCDCFMDRPLWGTDQYAQNKDRFNRVLEACSTHSVAILVIPLVDSSSITNSQQVIDLQNILSQFYGFMKKNGLRVAFETDLNPSDTVEFLSDFDPELFGINYDIGNSASNGYLYSEEFSAYGSRILNVHVKDRDFGGGTVPLGDGDALLNETLSALETLGYSGRYILQTARCYDGRDAEVLSEYKDLTLKYLQSNWLQDDKK